MTAARLTPAQARGLALLATPGAEARRGTPSRWRVLVGDAEIGSIHSESLAALRDAGLVDWVAPVTGGHVVQRITAAGRERAGAAAPVGGAP